MEIAKYIQKESFPAAIDKINGMAHRVDLDYHDTTAGITTDAYKFLHYHLEYLENKLQ